jgi:hypothetical protein
MSTQRAAEATSRPGCYEYPTQCNSQQFARYCLGQPRSRQLPRAPNPAEIVQPSHGLGAAGTWSLASSLASPDAVVVLTTEPKKLPLSFGTVTATWSRTCELATNSRILLKRFRFCAFMPPNNGVPATWARGGRWYGQAQAGRTSAPPLRGTHRPQTSPPRTTRLSKRKPAVPAPGLVGTRIAEK